MTAYRIEKDSLGEVRVPADRLYGAQTQRALENFPISGLRMPRPFIRALGLIKGAAADVNAELGLLAPELAHAIRQAADEVAEGKWDDHFPVDVFQSGSGTSTNMNANEVIAHRATQLLGGDLASPLVHPNDHVNMCQSSNDVIPTAIHISAYQVTHDLLLPGLRHLDSVLQRRAAELDGVVKTGRTHLMDALPVRMGQEVSGWAFQIRQGIERIEGCLPRLAQLTIGGTAVGTGLNAHPEFATRVVYALAARTGSPFVVCENHFAAQAALDTVAELSGQLKVTACALMKIANDVRWMGSGPIAGLGEITLPALQPGSSIMAGKVNPVICEAVMMVCAQVMANDAAITIGDALGNFELNTMMPLIAYNVLQSLTILGNAARLFADKVVAGFVINRQRIEESIERNPILVSALNPVIGYDKAAEIARRAYAERRRVRHVAAEMTGIKPDELLRLLDPCRMTEGGILAR
ncbi:MAG: class II fumarate hydratase [Anaerolineae bacterium]|nr:class II fumarate hydratase [Anaerolineae bacterium]MDW8071432.1 class II fumarate hydratase [Anaerolineae bacterium]